MTHRETPQSVSVITRQRIDDQALGSLDAVLREMPGVLQGNGGTPLGSSRDSFARGYQLSNFEIDGISVPGGSFTYDSRFGMSSLDSAIYDAVTVVRGATGLLSNAGDPSGRVSLVRKRPTDEFQASASVGLGRWNQRRMVGDLSGRLNEAGSVRGRLVAAHDDSASWIDRYRGDRGVVYGKLEADPTALTRLTLAFEYGRTSANAAGPYSGFGLLFGDGSLVPPSRSYNSLTSSSSFRDRRSSITAKIEHAFSSHWRGQLGYNVGRYRLAQRRYTANVGATPDSDMSLELYPWQGENTAHALDAGLQGSYELLGRRHDLVFGLNASRESGSEEGGYGNVDTVPFSAWTGRVTVPVFGDIAGLPYDYNSSKLKQWGYYAATRLRPADGLAVILGGRMSNWQSTNQLLPQSTSYDPATALLDDRKERNIATPYAGLVFDVTRSASVYASYTEIFRPQQNRTVSGARLDPERGTNVELGLKGEWFDGRLNASAAVFEIRKDNLAVLDGANRAPNGSEAYRAEDNTKGRGWELEVTGQLAPGWQIQASYTHVKIRDSEGNALNFHNPVDYFKLFTTYTPPAFNRLTLGGGIRWQSKIHAWWIDQALVPTYTQKAYSVIDLMGRYRLDRHWSLDAHLGNLLDKGYRTAVDGHAYGAPRNLFVNLRYDY